MSKLATTVKSAKRLWPILLMGYERWQRLPQDKKDAYMRQAQAYADKGRKTLASRSAKKKKR